MRAPLEWGWKGDKNIAKVIEIDVESMFWVAELSTDIHHACGLDLKIKVYICVQYWLF